MENKIITRKQAKEIRQTLDINKISEEIVQNIKNLSFFKNAKNIMIFHPLQHEINLLELLKSNSEKQFYLPRMNNNNLETCPYNIDDNLVLSKFKILEPASSAVDKNIIDIVFIPALCTDKNFNRLGYGKGFYDNFLSDFKSLKICPCPDELVLEEIPTEKHDIKMDLIITQNKIYKK